MDLTVDCVEWMEDERAYRVTASGGYQLHHLRGGTGVATLVWMVPVEEDHPPVGTSVRVTPEPVTRYRRAHTCTCGHHRSNHIPAPQLGGGLDHRGDCGYPSCSCTSYLEAGVEEMGG